MQYVRSISGSVSKTWNSINPATLSGAIDVIVIEQEDGMLQFKTNPILRNLLFLSLLRARLISVFSPLIRHSRLLALPCTLRQVFAPASI